MNINSVARNGLCSACGACAGICPVKAITMIYNEAGFLYAEIDKNKCINCGKCLKICPSQKENILSDSNTKEYILGNISKGYIGYSTDKMVREGGQSGGVVSGLLCFLLEKEEIEGAVVSSFDKDENRPKVKYVETKEEIIRSQGSHYCQTDMVRGYLENCDKKIATVLLGCQAYAISKIEKNKMSETDTGIKIGLFCGGQFSRFIIRDLLQQAKVSQAERVLNFRFRDKREGGCPGDVKIETDKGNYVLPRTERIKLFDIWKCHRCTECLDFYNQECDIVCGDPWGIDKQTLTEKGATVILVRTKKGQELIDAAIEEKVIYVEEIPPQLIIDGQGMLGTIEERCRNTTANQNKRQYSYKLYFSEEKNLKRIVRSRKRKNMYAEIIVNAKNIVKKLIKRYV